MNTVSPTSAPSILRQNVLGSRRLSNYWWAVVTSLGGVGFLLSGLSSYYKINLLPLSDPTQLLFFPQGLAMTFYGVAGTLLALYLWMTIILDVGGGYNEFNATTGQIFLFRWGFPGKNRKVEVKCQTKDVQSVKVEIQEGLNPRRAIYLKLRDRREYPLTRVGQPMTLESVETQAAELARFLSVPLEGLA